MKIPSHMEITASLMAGYRFEDGSLLEVDSAGDYRITDASGSILIDTLVPPWTGHDLRMGTPPEDYGEIADDLAAFLGHDAEIIEFSDQGSWGKQYPASAKEVDEEELIFPIKVAIWAEAHNDELSMLANYREDKRLGEDDPSEPGHPDNPRDTESYSAEEA